METNAETVLKPCCSHRTENSQEVFWIAAIIAACDITLNSFAFSIYLKVVSNEDVSIPRGKLMQNSCYPHPKSRGSALPREVIAIGGSATGNSQRMAGIRATKSKLRAATGTGAGFRIQVQEQAHKKQAEGMYRSALTG